MNSLAIAGIQVQNTILKKTQTLTSNCKNPSSKEKIGKKNTNSNIKLQESKLKTQTLTSNSRNPSSKHKL
jgi:hypothetical protein